MYVYDSDLKEERISDGHNTCIIYVPGEVGVNARNQQHAIENLGTLNETRISRRVRKTSGTK
jgi:hypothetical protein